MALHYKRMTSIAEAREYLAAGLLYENMSEGLDPYWRPTDRYTHRQLNELEECGDSYEGHWPITDYAILLED